MVLFDVAIVVVVVDVEFWLDDNGVCNSVAGCGCGGVDWISPPFIWNDDDDNFECSFGLLKLLLLLLIICPRRWVL